MQSLSYSSQRSQELSQRLDAVRDSIAQACTDYSAVRTANSPEPELTVVTKFFPASDVAALYDMGVRTVGENRDQEASAKAEDLAQYVSSDDPLRWSYIGQLQSNKAKSVVKYAAEVHSVDRLSLANALMKAYALQVSRFENGEGVAPSAYQNGLNCLVQVSLEEDGSSTAGQAAQGQRGGASVDTLLQIAEALENAPGLWCGGVMAVAPLGMEPDRAFEKLWNISQNLQKEFPQAHSISAGMSSDLEAAIRWGSTNVRIGSQIMGPRPSVG